MSKDVFNPQKVPTECNEDAGYHIFPTICKCEYDKKEQRRKQINNIATHCLDKDIECQCEDNPLQLIKELSDDS